MGLFTLHHIFRDFKKVELVLLAYLLFTLAIALIQVFTKGFGNGFIVAHLLIILLIVLVANLKMLNTLSWFSVLRLFYPLLLLGFLYTETDFLNNLIFSQNLDPQIVALEQTLFHGQPSLWFSQRVPSNLFAELMYFGYFAYYLMLLGLPVLVYIKKGALVAEQMVFMIIQSFVVFYLFFILVPVAGPQYYFNRLELLPQGYLFGDLIRLIQRIGEAPTAAFPSSHVALCLIMVFMAYREFKFWAFLLMPIALLLILSTVYIQAHYLIDILAAFVAAPIVYMLSFKVSHCLKPYYGH